MASYLDTPTLDGHHNVVTVDRHKATVHDGRPCDTVALDDAHGETLERREGARRVEGVRRPWRRYLQRVWPAAHFTPQRVDDGRELDVCERAVVSCCAGG